MRNPLNLLLRPGWSTGIENASMVYAAEERGSGCSGAVEVVRIVNRRRGWFGP